jgi:hypothetical protein
LKATIDTDIKSNTLPRKTQGAATQRISPQGELSGRTFFRGNEFNIDILDRSAKFGCGPTLD